MHPHEENRAAPATQLREALRSPDASTRLQAALTAGTNADAVFATPLVEQCAVESDFYVRDMLTWALTRLPRESTLPLVLAELSSEVPQARSQALHTLSKFGDADTWCAIRRDHLHDEDDEVARAAWRTAAGLVPDAEVTALVDELVLELGRGDLDVHRSLSRALAELGETTVPKLEWIANDPDAASDVRIHARATLRLIEDPEASFVLDRGEL